MGTVTNPLGSLLNGLVTGYGLAHQIKQQAMQEEAHQRAMADMDREAQVKDIQTRMMLDQNARPVNGGAVQDQVQMPSGGSSALEAVQPSVGVVRPVDKSRRVSYKGRDGQSQDYELLTPEEQIQRQIQRAMASPQMLTEQFRERAADLRANAGNASRERISESTNASRERTAAANTEAINKRATDANASRERVAQGNQTAANKRAADRNATTIQAAGIRRDIPTPGQQGVADRFKQRQLENDQKALRDLDQKEAALHAEKVQVGQMNPGPKDNSADFVKQREAKLKALDIRIRGIAESKKQIAAKWQGNPEALNPPTPPAITQTTRPRAVNPQTGEAVKFDGTNWVPVK